MTEREKAEAGYLYDANYDKELEKLRFHCMDLCWEYNQLKPSETEKQRALLKQILGSMEDDCMILPPFRCDYGYNVRVGKAFFANYNAIMLDGAPITFGDHVFIAPNCVFTTANHALDTQQRNAGLEVALPITVGDNVWFGANVTVLPGVTIGSNTVIGAGSVVTRDIPSGVIAVGNPCRVMRQITEADKHRYPAAPEDRKDELV
ncbi:MAG TPA: maltose acetyltransferase [Ruminococcus sp.]|nr:maltose acetyltransferase [Ruminococcus sp.]